MRPWKYMIVPGLMVLSGEVALAVPQETAALTAVDSIGFSGDPENVIVPHTFVGGYNAVRLHITGTLVAQNVFTWRTDARVRIAPPGGAATMIVQPFATGAEFTTATVTGRVFTLPVPVAAAGEWSFRFYESTWDDGGLPDAIWQDISFTLDDSDVSPGEVLSPSGNSYTEIEDNDSKARANRIVSLAPGQTITGTTQGSSTTTPGIASADYFRIKTQGATTGIYRHRLALTSVTSGHVGSIRGLTQIEGAIQAGTDVEAQGSSPATSPARMNQWYGFGKQEELYYRVSGINATTQPYVATYSVEPVMPLEAPRNFAPGTLTVTSQGQGHSTDTDLWIYDAQLNAIPGLGNDDISTDTNGLSAIVADFVAGEYYLAVAPYNIANSLPSVGTGEDWANGNVMDFANSLVQNTITTGDNVSVSISDAAGAVPVVATRAGPYDVVWVKFTVGEPVVPCPADLDNGSGSGTPDQAVTIDDLLYFLVEFEAGTLGADLDNDGDPAQGVPDGAVTIDDLLFFLVRFEQGC